MSGFTSQAWTRPRRHFRHGSLIAVETWNAKSRVKNHKPAAHTLEARWGTGVRLIQCKVGGNEKQIAKNICINPSSKTGFKVGWINKAYMFGLGNGGCKNGQGLACDLKAVKSTGKEGPKRKPLGAKEKMDGAGARSRHTQSGVKFEAPAKVAALAG